MKKSTFGFILIILLGTVGILVWKYLMPILFEKKQFSTSDSADTMKTIRIGGDNYLGYWFMTSPEMRKSSARKGLRIDFSDDGGIYAERLKKFNQGDYDCIVLPINTYLKHGSKYDYPGVIVAAISESRGADGIVGYKDKFPSGKINDLNDPSLKIVYTPDSPSSFLLNLTIADFDLNQLQNSKSWQVHADGSSKVLNSALKGEGDVFVLWEPDLSKALEVEGIKYIWGSDKFSGYIVDVFVFRRDFLEKRKDMVMDFLSIYFRTMNIYSNNMDLMIKEMSNSTDLKKDVIKKLLDKIEWYDIQENCETQFGLNIKNQQRNVSEGLINSIIACTDVMLRSGTIDNDPLKGNPYLITNSKILEELSDMQIPKTASTGNREIKFDELSESEWHKLKEIGTFRVEPITFQSWNNLLTNEGKEKVDKIANLLKNNYPNYRIIIRGHTAPGGDEKENRKLSRQRAEAVEKYLKVVHGFPKERIRYEGVGSNFPALKKPGESYRSYQYRLSRVEFVAVEGHNL